MRPGHGAPITMCARGMLGALVLLSAALQPVGADTLVDDSFEEDDLGAALTPLDWTCAPLELGSDGVGQWARGMSHRGSRSLSIGQTAGRCAYLGPVNPVREGEWVRASAWASTWRCEIGASIGVMWYGERGRIITVAESEPKLSEGGWTRLRLEAPTPAGAKTVRPFLALAGSGMAWFDDVRVVTRPTAPIVVEEVNAGDARPGGRCSVSLTVRVSQPTVPVESIGLELVALRDARRVAQGSFPLASSDTVLEAGLHRLGPFELQVDPYVPSGPCVLRVRWGDVVLDSVGLANGIVDVSPRRPAVEGGGHWASLELEGPAQVIAGERVPVSVTARVQPRLDSALIAAIELAQGRAVYAATEIVLAALGDSSTGVATHCGHGHLPVPAGVGAGDYTLRALLTGPFAEQPHAEVPCGVASLGSRGKPVGRGSYRSSAGAVHYWRIEPSGVLVWDGFPYMPVGGMIRTSYLNSYRSDDPAGNDQRWRVFEERTRVLAEAGVHDVYVVTSPRGLAGLPTEAVQRVVDRLEALGFRYGLEIGGPADAGFVGYRVGKAYSLGGITTTGEAVIPISDEPLPEGALALVALYDERTGQPVAAMRVPMLAKAVAIRVAEGVGRAGGTFVAYACPQVAVPPGIGSGNPADDTSFRVRRAAVAEALSSLAFGDGLRFLTNPLSGDAGMAPADVVPCFPSTFGRRFGDWLAQRYGGNIARLEQAWGLTEVPGFGVAGRLIPLCGPGPTIPLVEPDGGRMYLFDPGSSAYETDLEAFRQEIQAEALANITSSIKAIVDVPVLLEVEAGAELASRASDGEPLGAFLRQPRRTGRHLVVRDTVEGPDGITLSPPRLPPDVRDASIAVRLAENALSLRSPWLVATRVRMVLGSADLTDAARWGARGLFVCWLSDDTGAEQDLFGNPTALSTVAAAGSDPASLLAHPGPGLLFAFPPRAATPAGPRDDRPLALDGEAGQGAARSIRDGCWLVPAAVLAEEAGPYVVSLSSARRYRLAAEEVDSALRSSSPPRMLYLGGRDDLGLVPSIDRFLASEPRACTFGSGEAQSYAPGTDLLQQGEFGGGILATSGALTLFPVRGLRPADISWLLDRLLGPAESVGAPVGLAPWRLPTFGADVP